MNESAGGERLAEWDVWQRLVININSSMGSHHRDLELKEKGGKGML